MNLYAYSLLLLPSALSINLTKKEYDIKFQDNNKKAFVDDRGNHTFEMNKTRRTHDYPYSLELIKTKQNKMMKENIKTRNFFHDSNGQECLRNNSFKVPDFNKSHGSFLTTMAFDLNHTKKIEMFDYG